MGKIRQLLFISKGEKASSTVARALVYFPFWQKYNITPIHISTNFLGNYLKILWCAWQADVVIIIRKLFPKWYLSLLCLLSRKMIFECDDAIFVKNTGAFSNKRQFGFENIIKYTDGVIVGNQYLASKAMASGAANILIAPTAVEAEKYQVTNSKPDQHVDLIWVGSTSTRPYLVDIMPVLERAATLLPKLRLKIVADFELSSAQLKIQNIPWGWDSEAYDLAAAHIGLAPSIDNDWTRGKCGMKVVQYMAASLPVIASRTGVHMEQVMDGRTGFLVSTPDEWIAALEKFYYAPALIAEMGRNGYQHFLENFELNASFNKRYKFIQQLVEKT